MSASLYRRTTSPGHARHPVAKLLALPLLFVPPLAFNDPVWALGTLGVSLLIVALTKAWPSVRRVLVLGVTLLVVSTIIWALMLPGHEHVWSLGPVGASPLSVAYGLAIGLRLNALLLVGVAFVTCTRPEAFTYALRHAGMPATATLALSLAFRLLPMLAETTRTVTEAQISRGLDLRRGGPLTRARRYVPLMVPILTYALRTADDLTRALEARGLGAASGGRTELRVYTWRWADTALLALALALAALSVWARVSGNGEIVDRL